jgi:putative phosphoesterase
MKILVLSDSHSGLSFMRRCIEGVMPDVVIHLGDHYDDGEAMQEEYPNLRFYRVPGNCDRYRASSALAETLVEIVGGVKLYMTHGHNHEVKRTLVRLLADARAMNAAAALYGHTHCPDCHREDDGLWVLNPGSCGYYGGSAGLIVTEQGEILDCRILRDEDLYLMSEQ